MNQRKRDKDVDFYEAKKAKEHNFYDNINIIRFKRDLPKPLKLWNMDKVNSGLGVTTKLWWETFFHSKFKDKKILDVGCGNCYHVPYWALHKNDIVGLDSSQASLDILSGFLRKLGLKARLKKGFIEDVVFHEKFDIVNFNNMLHHVESIPKSLSNARKVIKEDGYLIVVEPIYHFPFRWIVETDFLKSINIFKKHFIKKDLYYEEEKALSAKKYLRYICRAGFKPVYVNYDTNFFGYALTLLGVKNRTLKKVVYGFDKIFTRLFVLKSIRSFIYVIAKPVQGGTKTKFYKPALVEE